MMKVNIQETTLEVTVVLETTRKGEASVLGIYYLRTDAASFVSKNYSSHETVNQNMFISEESCIEILTNKVHMGDV